jgi:hydroxyethylthiazole kinase
VYRKDALGQAGYIYGDPNRTHVEIICDDDNLKNLVGRSTGKLDITKNGRSDAVYGEMYFHLPAGTQVFDKEPVPQLVAAHSPASTALSAKFTSTDAMIVGLRYAGGEGAANQRGDALLTSYTLDGATIGTALRETDAEYNLYTHATKISKAYPDDAAPAPSAVYELLRFGRVINTANEALTPADVPHWRKVNYPGGNGWVNLNATGVTKFSDADFPHWKGWLLIDDDTDVNSQCNSATIRAWLDTDGDGKIDPNEALNRLSNDKIQDKLKRTICKFPTEWEKATVDARWGWLMEETDENPAPLTPEDFLRLREHIEALCFWEDSGMTISSKHWHFQPREFIGQMRMCGWLSEGDIVRVTRKTIMDGKKEVGKLTINTIHERLSTSEDTRPPNLNPALQKMMRKYIISSPHRIAYLMSQLARETERLKYMVEIGDNPYFDKYKPGTDQGKKLGNTEVGDGLRFKGRGLIQITGRDNYTNYGTYRGMDFLSDSAAASLVTDAYLTCDASGAFWASKQRHQYDAHNKLIPFGKLGINSWADIGVSETEARQVTKCINTACDAFDEVRWPCFEHAWYALNDEATAPDNFKPILP